MQKGEKKLKTYLYGVFIRSGNDIRGAITIGNRRRATGVRCQDYKDSILPLSRVIHLFAYLAAIGS